MNSANTLATVCKFLSQDEKADASETLKRELPFDPVQTTKRVYTSEQALAVFRRDGFIDRYSGARLVFPGTLRLLSIYFPDLLPYHTNWKMSESHFCYWTLYPTLDHILPVCRGGLDEESNWVTTCQVRNSAKNNSLLHEIGWSLHPPGDLSVWDGLQDWFIPVSYTHLTLPTILRV